MPDLINRQKVDALVDFGLVDDEDEAFAMLEDMGDYDPADETIDDIVVAHYEK
jgi:hypothetical protein